MGGVKGSRRLSLATSPPSVSRLSKENVGASTSHKLMGLHGLLPSYLYVPLWRFAFVSLSNGVQLFLVIILIKFLYQGKITVYYILCVTVTSPFLFINTTKKQNTTLQDFGCSIKKPVRNPMKLECTKSVYMLSAKESMWG
jgi:hypothetical protein